MKKPIKKTSAKLEKLKANIAKLELQKGDKTNFGSVINIGETGITFKNTYSPKTRILFIQRKFGRNEYVLNDLIKL
jgi:hypothetical protein